jgi:hypothetical protein
LTGGEEELQGKTLIAKLKTSKAAPAAKKPEARNSDPSKIEAKCKEFIAQYAKVSSDANIAASVNKFTTFLKSTFKSDTEASLRFDPTGTHTCPLDVFAELLSQQVPGITSEEVLAMAFIPMDASGTTINEISMLSLKMYLFQSFSRKEIAPA